MASWDNDCLDAFWSVPKQMTFRTLYFTSKSKVSLGKKWSVLKTSICRSDNLTKKTKLVFKSRDKKQEMEKLTAYEGNLWQITKILNQKLSPIAYILKGDMLRRSIEKCLSFILSSAADDNHDPFNSFSRAFLGHRRNVRKASDLKQ